MVEVLKDDEVMYGLGELNTIKSHLFIPVDCIHLVPNYNKLTKIPSVDYLYEFASACDKMNMSYINCWYVQSTSTSTLFILCPS